MSETEKPKHRKRKCKYTYYFGNLNGPDKTRVTVKVPEVDFEYMYEHKKIKPIILKSYLNTFKDILDAISVMKCVMHERAEENWKTLTEYEGIDERYNKLSERFHNWSNNKHMLRIFCTISNIVYAGYTELTYFGTFSIMLTALGDYIHLMHDEAELYDEVEVRRAHIKKLKLAIVAEKKKFIHILEKKYYHLFQCTQLLEDVRAYTLMENRYVSQWEATRVDQKTYELNEKEDFYNNIKSDLEIKTDSENRVHNEIELFIQERINDLRNEIEFWMEQYDKESDERDNEMSEMRIEVEIQKDKLEKRKAELEFRTKFIEERLAIKEARRQEAARILFEKYNATKIQAWWRGVMVRRFLGKYKKLKTKLAKKKKAKRGKKKKK